MEWGNSEPITQTFAAFFQSDSEGKWGSGVLPQGRRKESRARGADRSKRAPTTLGQQIYPRNGGHPKHFLGNIMGYASHSHINDCLFQSDIACF